MTRWGVLADIHGNRPALERALAEFEIRQVERIAVLGDNLGRGDSDGCVETIRRIADISVQGNRDLDWQDRVGEAARAYVLGLPRVSIVDGVAFSHGDARLTRELSSSEIRNAFRRTRAWLAENSCRALLFGHTHRARVWTLGQPEDEPHLHFDAAADRVPATVLLGEPDPASIWVVNAGSVGLPFPGKGPASANVFDTATGVVEFFAV